MGGDNNIAIKALCQPTSQLPDKVISYLPGRSKAFPGTSTADYLPAVGLAATMAGPATVALSAVPSTSTFLGRPRLRGRGSAPTVGLPRLTAVRWGNPLGTGACSEGSEEMMVRET